MEKISLEEVMQALSDPCRLSIARTLIKAKGKELACNEFGLKVSKATGSHHFEVLRAAGLIVTRVEGTKCLSSLRAEELDRHFPGLLKMLELVKK